MQGLSKIIVGVDVPELPEEDEPVLSAATQEAVDRGIWLAAKNGAAIHFLCVLDEPRLETEDLVEDTHAQELMKHAESVLAGLKQTATEQGVTATAAVVNGRSWYELIRAAVKSEADLVVTGSRSHSTARRLVFGTTSMKLLRKCPCPVLVLRPERKPAENEPTTIVVADDFTEVGERCLHLAVGFAQLCNARLLAIHALELPLEKPLLRSGMVEDEVQKYRQKSQAEAEQQLVERLSGTDYRTIEAGTLTEVGIGPAETVIADAIAKHSADLLVMGTVARGGIPGFLIGNTAERLLPEVDCSILAIKPDNFHCPLKFD
ncbi:Universal stress protein E [Maioricimonas rarisocia]|uniref:Universal stress protein E n=1 Tax=Maioricimonas rarisocia TaxID=2528026 RepID=A0A517Z6Y1_9PLAN|nr:universal stress protein [Maioricimonas rarisocia]QDU38248.1 Universal stress protein E [Maioricimonas rarisocia]